MDMSAVLEGKQELSESRKAFLVKTYNHLFGAILLFTGLEVFYFTSGFARQISGAMMNNWLLVLGGFMLVSWMARSAAYKAKSRQSEYAALGAFVFVESIIFAPLLLMAEMYAPGAIQSAAVTTLIGFAGLTWLALSTGKDFSFLGSFLKWAGIGALAAIVSSLIFGFTLGTLFSVLMIFVAGAAILFDTSVILREFPEDRYVAASLELFASVALLFWYVLRLFMAFGRD
ncbi:MAG: Bax inhibitor-1/YccA family protein [Fibrobacterota bacterium]